MKIPAAMRKTFLVHTRNATLIVTATIVALRWFKIPTYLIALVAGLSVYLLKRGYEGAKSADTDPLAHVRRAAHLYAAGIAMCAINFGTDRQPRWFLATFGVGILLVFLGKNAMVKALNLDGVQAMDDIRSVTMRILLLSYLPLIPYCAALTLL